MLTGSTHWQLPTTLDWQIEAGCAQLPVIAQVAARWGSKGGFISF